jgi:hypothetical protein
MHHDGGWRARLAWPLCPQPLTAGGWPCTHLRGLHRGLTVNFTGQLSVILIGLPHSIVLCHRSLTACHPSWPVCKCAGQTAYPARDEHQLPRVLACHSI